MSVQRSVFTLAGRILEDVEGLPFVEPSAPRVLPKGARFIGAQFVLLPSDAPVFPASGATFETRLQGRNGPTDDDWVDVNDGDGPPVGDSGPVSEMFDGVDQLVRIEQFTEIRVVGEITGGMASGNFDDVTFGVFVKTDYPTG